MAHHINHIEGLQNHGNRRPSGDHILGGHGRFRGQSATLMNRSNGLVESAAEEMSFFAPERLQNEFKQFRFKDHNPLGKLLSEQIHNLLERFPNHKQEAQAIVSKILLQKHMTETEVLKHLDKLTQNPSLKALSLMLLLKDGSGQLASAAIRSALEEELKRLWDKHKKEINATINISASVRKALKAHDQFSAEGLRDLYIDSVLDYGGLDKTYEKLVDQYGHGNLKESLEFLLSALGDDMRAAERSIPQAQLRMLISDMSKLKILIGVHEQCYKLCSKLHQVTPASEDDMSKTLDVLLSLMSYSWAVPEKIRKLVDTMGLRDVGEEIYFIRGFREITRNLPVRVFKDEYARAQLLQAIQDLLDHKIESEEEEMEL